MTEPVTKTFGDLIVEIEGATPDSWIAPCGFTSKALNLTQGTSDATIPDCDDPNKQPWTYRGGGAKAGEVTGAGVYATENAAFYEGWFDSGAIKKIRVTTVGVGYRTGPARLTALGQTVAFASDAGLVQRPITIVSAGAWPWTAGDPDDA